MADLFDRKADRMQRRANRGNNNAIAGVFLLLAGVGIILKKSGAPLPEWLFTWEMLIILVGLYSGFKSKFAGSFWALAMLTGGFLLANNYFLHYDIDEYIWPGILILLGLIFIFPKIFRSAKCPNDRTPDKVFDTTQPASEQGEAIEVVSVFAGVKRVVVSKYFKGGEIVAVLGGADIDLSHTDIQGVVRLEAVNFMGGTKLVIPASWNVQSDMTAVFGSVEDKREIKNAAPDNGKLLILEGVCVFGGLEIRNF